MLSQNSVHLTELPSAEQTQQELIIQNKFHNQSVKEPVTQNYITNSPDRNLPNKRYFSNYSLATESEKEKIINLFYKIFRDYNFSNREEKDMILRHIRLELIKS